MITFVVLDDHLLYRAKAIKTIHQVMKKNSGSYRILNTPVYYDTSLKIYLIDLDQKDIFKILHKIRLHDSRSKIIVFSNYPNLRTLLQQQHLQISAFLSKENIYQGCLDEVLVEILNFQESKVLVIDQEGVHCRIPMEDIMMITNIENMLCLDAVTKEGAKYQYILRDEDQKIRSQLGNQFLQANRFCMYPNIVKKKHAYQKPYTADYRKKIIHAYIHGTSITELSNTYGPCKSTIRRWIKEREYQKKLLTLQSKARKFDQISGIVKEGD